MDQQKEVTAIELKRLLHDLKDKRPDIGIRFRIIGTLWSANFTFIKKIGDAEFVVTDGAEKEKYLNRFQDIIQFEIDSPFQAYRPFYHYQVNPLKEEKFA